MYTFRKNFINNCGINKFNNIRLLIIYVSIIFQLDVTIFLYVISNVLCLCLQSSLPRNHCCAI